MWVKLTKPDGKDIYVNMDRFDTVEALQDEDGNWRSLISSCLSAADDDSTTIEVVEMPEVFLEKLIIHGR